MKAKKTKTKEIPFEEVKDKYIEFFNKNGIPATPEEGEKLKLDPAPHDVAKRNKWSINIVFLENTGLVVGYYRGSDKAYTVHGAFNDLYLKDVKLLSNNFIHMSQLKSLHNYTHNDNNRK